MAATVLDTLCAQGLPGAPPLPNLDSSEWGEMLKAGRRERVLALVAEVVHERGLALSDEVRRELTTGHQAVMQSCLLLERATIEVGDLFDEQRIEYRVLKGPAVAHLDYPSPSWRQFGDVDVLVRGASYDAAVRALESRGGHRRSAEIRVGFDRRFGKGVCVRRSDGIQVDVHRTLASGPFGHTIGLDTLFLGNDRVRLGDRDIPTLTRECRFIHACVHAVLGDERPRAGVLRDVAQLLLMTDLDVDRVVSLAHEWRLTSVMATAIATTWGRLHLTPTPISLWAKHHRGEGFERRALAAYHGPNRSYARQMIAGIPAIRGAGAKASYVGSLLLVDGAYARRHDGGQLRRVARALRSLPRRRGRRS